MILLTLVLRTKLPPLYATEKDSDPLVQCKFFTPWTYWTWLITEFDGNDTLFGWVYGDFAQLGYFSLAELESIQGPWGLKIERDIGFHPCPMSVAQEQIYLARGRR